MAVEGYLVFVTATTEHARDVVLHLVGAASGFLHAHDIGTRSDEVTGNDVVAAVFLGRTECHGVVGHHLEASFRHGRGEVDGAVVANGADAAQESDDADPCGTFPADHADAEHCEDEGYAEGEAESDHADVAPPLGGVDKHRGGAAPGGGAQQSNRRS